MGEVKKALLRLSGAAEQKHALLAEHVPEPPGRVEPQRAAIEIERDRALHLDVDLIAELHEILDWGEKRCSACRPRSPADSRCAAYGRRPIAAAASARTRNSETTRWRDVRSAANSPAPRAAAALPARSATGSHSRTRRRDN